jgi:hypothetical protein
MQKKTTKEVNLGEKLMNNLYPEEDDSSDSISEGRYVPGSSTTNYLSATILFICAR